MRPKTITISPTAADRDGVSTTATHSANAVIPMNGDLASGYDADGIVTATTPAAAGTMTINGGLKTDSTHVYFSSPRFLCIYSDGDDSGVTFSFTGTDKDGNAQYETIAGPNAVIKATTKKFLSVTNVSISGAGTGSITIGSVGVATLADVGHVSIYSAGDESDVTFTVYGTDRYGQDISEAITGPDTTTVKGEYNFATVGKVEADGAVGNAVEIGSADELDSQWIPMDKYGGDITVGVTLSSGAGMTYTVEHTFTDLQTTGFKEYSANVFTHDSLNGEVSSGDGTYTVPVTGIRLAVSSFTSGTATMEITQAR